MPARDRTKFFKTDHTSYFLILKNGVVKRRFFVPKNNFRPDKAPTHVRLCRIFSPFIFRLSVSSVHILDIVLLENGVKNFIAFDDLSQSLTLRNAFKDILFYILMPSHNPRTIRLFSRYDNLLAYFLLLAPEYF